MSEAVHTWIDIGALEDPREGELTDIEVDGEHVLLVRLSSDTVVAYQGICLHQEYLLIDSDFDPATGILTCGGHHWQFRLSDGQGINPSNCELYRYPVCLEGGRILIGLPPTGVRRYHRCRD